MPLFSSSKKNPVEAAKVTVDALKILAKESVSNKKTDKVSLLQFREGVVYSRTDEERLVFKQCASCDPLNDYFVFHPKSQIERQA